MLLVGWPRRRRVRGRSGRRGRLLGVGRGGHGVRRVRQGLLGARRLGHGREERLGRARPWRLRLRDNGLGGGHLAHRDLGGRGAGRGGPLPPARRSEGRDGRTGGQSRWGWCVAGGGAFRCCTRIGARKHGRRPSREHAAAPPRRRVALLTCQAWWRARSRPTWGGRTAATRRPRLGARRSAASAGGRRCCLLRSPEC